MPSFHRWAYIVSTIIYLWNSVEVNCNVTGYAIEFFMGLVTVSCSVLLACRTIVVYQGRARQIVSIAVTVGALAVTAAWMAGVPDVTSEWKAGAGPIWAAGACQPHEIPVRYSIKYLITIAYDFMVLALTVGGIYSMQSSQTHLGNLLLSQGIIYFLATFVANAVVCGLCLARLNPIMSLVGAVPSSFVAMISATRLYTELAEQARPAASTYADDRRSQRKEQGMSSSSTFGASKFGSFFGATSSRTRVSNRGEKAFLKGQLDLEAARSLPIGVGELSYGGVTPNVELSAKEFLSGSMIETPFPAEHTTVPTLPADEEIALARSSTSPRRDSKKLPFDDTVSGISVEQSVTVESQPTPEHFKGSHFLNQEQLAAVTGTDPVDLDFPHLSATNSPASPATAEASITKKDE